MAKRLVVEIVGDPSGLSAALGKASATANSFGSRIAHVGESVASVGKHMVLFGGIVAAGAGELGKQFVEAGMQAQEQTGKLDVAMRNAGPAADGLKSKVDALEASGRRLGFTNADTRESITELVQAGDNATKTTKDLALAQDYARIKNISLASAATAVVKVHQGLLRPLKELGISLPSLTDHMKALTDAHKKSKAPITATEKALAFQQDKEETGARAIALMTQKLKGQAKEFANSAAGGMQSFSAQIGNIKERLGTSLLPLVSKLTSFLASLADKFSSLSPHMQKIVALSAAGAFAFGVIVIALGSVLTAIGEVSQAFMLLAANPIVLVIVGIAALAAAIAAAVIWPDKLRSVLEHMGLSAQQAGAIVGGLQKVFEVVKTASEALLSAVRANWPQIEAIIKGVIDIVRTVITDAVSVVMGIWSRFHSQIKTIALAAWNYIKATIQNALQAIRGIVDIIGGLLHGDWSRVWQGIKEVLGAAVNQLMALMRYAGSVLGALASVAGKLIKDNILKPVGELLSALASKVADIVSWFKALPGKIVAALGDMSTILVNAGKDVIQGFIHGIESKFDDVKNTLGHLGHKLTRWKGPPSYDVTILQPAGQLVIQGFINGLESKYQDVQKSLKGFGDRLALAADIQAAARHIGIAQAEQIAQGFMQQQPTLEQQIRQGLREAVQQAAQAVNDARSSFTSAFSSLAQSALQAFDDKMSKWVPPAMKLLDKMQLQDQVTQAKRAIADATQQLADAQKAAQDAATALATAQSAGPQDGESQADYQARIQQLQAQATDTQNQVVAAKQALGDAERQQTELNEQLLAQKQQEAHDKRMAAQREHLAQQLLALQRDLAKHPEEWRKINDAILALLKEYNVPLYQAGQKFADQLAGGLRSEIKNVENAAESLAQAVAKYIVTHSPADAGPLSKASPFDLGARIGNQFSAGLTAALYAGEGLSKAIPSIPSRSLGAGLGTPAGGRSAGVTVHLSMPNYLGDKNEVVGWIRDELTRAGKRDPNIFGGYA